MLCIGQMSIGVGRALRCILQDQPILVNGYKFQFLFIDDYGLEEPHCSPSDLFHRFDAGIYTWENGYNSGYAGVTEKLHTMLENCDNPTGVYIIYDAAGHLGSGLCCFLSEYIANNLPGLLLTTIGIVPHICAGGLAASNIMLSSYASGLYADCRLLRKLDDSEYILKSAGVLDHPVAGYDFIYTAVAADIVGLLLDAMGCAALCAGRGTIVDVRSSLWSAALNPLKMRYSCPSARGGRGEGPRTGVRPSRGDTTTDMDKTLRLMTMNIHSLHISTYPPFQSPHTSSTVTGIPAVISQASLVCLTSHRHGSHQHPSSYTPSPLLREQFVDVVAVWEKSSESGTPCRLYDTETSLPGGGRLLSMLYGCTGGVQWPERLQQHRLCDGRTTYRSEAGGGSERGRTSSGQTMGGVVNIATVCFTSPYARSILKGDFLARVERSQRMSAFFFDRSVN